MVKPTPDGYERMYVSPRRGKAHLTESSRDRAALCGIAPPFGLDFLGTGSQDEYDEAARRELCSNCRLKLPVDRRG